jgi:hypothetical protein
MEVQMTWSLRLALAACVLAASACGPVAARAGEPGVRADLFNGLARITLEGSYVGARYTVRRADTQGQPFQVLGVQNALCTGDCTILDPDALVGATYLYRFDVTGADLVPRTYGPYAVTIGGRAAAGLGASPSPNPLRDRGTLRVTAGLAAGARAGNPARATGLPGEVTLVDMSGRVIRTLWRGTLDRLTFDVPFSARDEQGRAIPPGLYFVVVRAGQHRSISRIAVVR